MKNIFLKEVSNELISRINNLSKDSQPLWGKMSVSQMLAHCCVTYEMVYSDKYQRPNAFSRFLLKTFVKKIVVSEKPYSKNGRTAPQFLITSEKEFDNEKKRLVDYIIKTQQLGDDYFNGKESHSFGKMNSKEWNNSFFKHLNHHLNQFGV